MQRSSSIKAASPIDSHETVGRAVVPGQKQDQPYPLDRALLIPLGPQAQAVAEEVANLSQRWLGAQPPLQHLPGLEPSTWEVQPDDIFAASQAAIDALADQNLLTQLQRQNYALKNDDELAIWLIIDVGSQAKEAPGSTVREDAGSAHLPAPSLNFFAAVVALTWQRLRVQAVGYALLLTEPSTQAEISPWLAALRQAEITSIYVNGPVNRRHVRLPATVWRQQTAAALTALLWSVFPSHHTQGDPSMLQTFGANLWLAPKRALCQWLAAKTALVWLDNLCDAENSVNPAQQRAQLPIPAPEQQLERLNHTAPPPQPNPLPRRPAWPRLHEVGQQIQLAFEQFTHRQAASQRPLRQQWLAAAIDAWQVALQALVDQHLQPQFTPAGALPSLPQGEKVLRSLQRHLQSEAATVDHALERIEAQISTADQRIHRARQTLDALCHALPASTLPALSFALLQPWHWPRWLWAYQVGLPAAQQQLCAALNERARLAWQEANRHTVRQLYLVILQDLHLAAGQIDQLVSHIRTVAQVIADDQRNVVNDAAPWTTDRLIQLWRRMLPTDSAAALADVVTQLPLTRWLDEEPAALAALMVEAAEKPFASIRQWSALECLSLAFHPNLADGEPQSSLSPLTAWLNEQFENAAPLWPSQPEQADRQGTDWLLVADAELPDGLQPLLRNKTNPLAVWATRNQTLAWAQGPATGIALLRVHPVVIE